MDFLAIFGAKYLIILSPLLLLGFLYRTDPETKKKLIAFGLLSLPLTYLAGVVARLLYYNPRPFVIGGFEPLISHATDNGFPSDHTLLLAALAVLVTFFDRRLAIALWLITIVTGASRIYAGVHHLIDIVGSILIALIAGWIVHFVLKREKKV